VSIVIRNRPWSAVLSDMIEGIIVANVLDRERADTVRTALWLSVEQPEVATAA